MDQSNIRVSRDSQGFNLGCPLLRWTAWLLSTALLLFVAACYWGRFDACTVVTLFPPWFWVLPGAFLAWLGSSRDRWLPSAVLLVGWTAFLAAFADTPSSLIRAALPQPERGAIRVITLNCASEAAAAREVQSFAPDIVLFQESPSSDVLSKFATELFGSSVNLVRGPDASILARGKVTPVEVPTESRGSFVHARVLVDGRLINVLSLRLYPCPVRLDLWSPACWRSYQSNRATRRRQLARIAAYLATLPADEPLVVGGDFNCPPGDPVLRLLQPRLTDAFRTAGRGWGATIIEFCGWPLIRIDQIWTSAELHATNVFARRAAGSDHHMVVADFSVGGSSPNLP